MHIVNGLDQARRALTQRSAILLSPPYAACHAGVGYYAAMLQQLRTEFPAQHVVFWVCCGNDPAIAHAALKSGLTHIICDTPAPMLEKLRAMAAQLMAEIRGQYPEIEIAEERPAKH